MSDPDRSLVTVSESLAVAVPPLTRLDPYTAGSRRFLGVADANALLSCVGNDCRKGHARRSGLLQMTAGGTATLYASDHVYWEVYEHLPRISKWSKVPVSVLRECFEEHYLPAVRFVSVDTSGITDPQVLAITDPDDVPSGVLAKQIAPCVVFSEDKHLREPGLAPGDWRAAASSGADLVEAALLQYALRQEVNAAAMPVPIAVGMTRWLGQRTGVSPWIIGAATVVGMAYFLRKPERRKALGKIVIPLLEEHSRRAELATAQERRGLEGLREVMLPTPPKASVKQQAAIVLARQPGPLLAREIQEHMLEHFPPGTVAPVPEIRSVLRDSPEFVSSERYRWQFGRQAAPWRPGI